MVCRPTRSICYPKFNEHSLFRTARCELAVNVHVRLLYVTRKRRHRLDVLIHTWLQNVDLLQ